MRLSVSLPLDCSRVLLGCSRVLLGVWAASDDPHCHCLSVSARPPEVFLSATTLRSFPACPCLSAHPGVPERNHKTDEVISTVRMLSDLVGKGRSRGGRRSLPCIGGNHSTPCFSSYHIIVSTLCTSHTTCQLDLGYHIGHIIYHSFVFSHLFHSFTPCQLDLGYRIGHISEKDDASGRLTDPLTKFDEVTAENLKYDMHDAKLFKKYHVS